METCRGSRRSHADRGWRDGRGFDRRTAGRGAPGRGAGPPTTQDSPGDADADPGGPQQTVGVPAAQAQGAAAAGDGVLAHSGCHNNHVDMRNVQVLHSMNLY